MVERLSQLSLVIELHHLFGGVDAAAVLDGIVAWGGVRLQATVDHGTKFNSKTLEDRAYGLRVRLDFIRAIKPTESGHNDLVHSRLRCECPAVIRSLLIDDAHAKVKCCRIDFGARRLRDSPGNLMPSEFARRASR